VNIISAGISLYHTYLSVTGTSKGNEVQRRVDNFFGVYDANGVTLPTKDRFISPRLFRENLHKVLDIEEVVKCQGPQLAVPSSYSEFVADGDAVDFLILGTIPESKLKVAVHSTYKHIEFYAIPEGSYDSPFTARSSAEAFVLSSTQAVLEELSSGVVEVVKQKGEERYVGDSVGFKLVDFDPPEFFDKDLVNKIAPVAEAAISGGVKTGVLLYGDYGVSKTTTVNKILSMFDVLKVRVANSAYSDAKKILEDLRTRKIVVIDDADIGNNAEKNEDVSELLNFLDSNSYDLVFIVVNDTKALCPAITRPGRCDIKIHCPKPDAKTITTILTNLKFADNDATQLSPNVVNTLLQYGATHALVKACYMNSIRYKISLEQSVQQTLAMEDQAAEATEATETTEDPHDVATYLETVARESA
jgi:hypothetical protein